MNDLMSYGRVPRAAMEAAINAPYGAAQAAIQDFVPDFVMRSGDNIVYDIDIVVTGQKTIQVAAPSESKALLLAEDYDCDVPHELEYILKRISPQQDIAPDMEWGDTS